MALGLGEGLSNDRDALEEEEERRGAFVLQGSSGPGLGAQRLITTVPFTRGAPKTKAGTEINRSTLGSPSPAKTSSLASSTSTVSTAIGTGVSLDPSLEVGGEKKSEQSTLKELWDNAIQYVAENQCTSLGTIGLFSTLATLAHMGAFYRFAILVAVLPSFLKAFSQWDSQFRAQISTSPGNHVIAEFDHQKAQLAG